MFDHLHWLPLIARVQLKVLKLTYACILVKLPSIYVTLSFVPSASLVVSSQLALCCLITMLCHFGINKLN